MEYTEGAVRELLTGIVTEALGESKPEISLNFAQLRFVKTDPVIVTCIWELPQAGAAAWRSRAFDVCFSGASMENFVAADAARLDKLRAAAVDAIRNARRDFDPGDIAAPYPYQCLVDRL